MDPRFAGTRCLVRAAMLAGATLLGVALAPGQDAERLTTPGRVERADGTPWPQARVTLIAHSFYSLAGVGEHDVIAVTADAGGRFRVPLLRDRAYSAWATEPTLHVVYGASAVVEDVVAGNMLRLVEKGRGRRVRVAVGGREVWRHAEPLGFTLVCYVPKTRWQTRLVLDAAGAALLPQLPHSAGGSSIHVTAASGVRIASLRIADGRPDEVAADARLEERSFHLPPSRMLTVRVESLFGGPVAGAAVLQENHGERHVLGHSDARGRVTFEQPDRCVLVEARGFERQEVKPWLADSGEADALETPGVPEITVELRPGAQVAGRLLDASGRPLAGKTMMLQTLGSQVVARGRSSKRINRLDSDLRVARTDALGRFEVAGLAKGTIVWIVAHVDGPWSGQYADERTPVAPRAPIVISACAADVDLGDVRFVPVDLSVVTADGMPGATAELFVLEDKEQVPGARWHFECFRPARNGRLRLLLPGGSRWVVGARVGLTQGRVETLVLPADLAALLAVELRLEAPFTIRGVVVDDRNRPVAGARLQAELCSDPLRAVDRLRRWIYGEFFPRQGPLQSDARGRFAIEVTQSDASYTVRALDSPTGVTVDLAAGPPDEVRIVVAR